MEHIGIILRIVMIVVGVFLLGTSISSLAKRKMTEPFCLTWGLISILIIIAGIILRPSEISHFISPKGLVLVMMAGFCVIYGLYFMSSRISELMRKNFELAEQVSLLNHEKDEINRKLEELSEKIK